MLWLPYTLCYIKKLVVHYYRTFHAHQQSAFVLISFYFLLLFFGVALKSFYQLSLIITDISLFLPLQPSLVFCSQHNPFFQLFLHNLLILKPDIIFFSFPPHLLWCVFLVLRAFFFFCIFPCLPYFVGFQLHRKDKIYRSRKVRKLYHFFASLIGQTFKHM